MEDSHMEFTDDVLIIAMINHKVRRKFELTLNEYCIADFIDLAANRPGNDTRWCQCPPEHIAEMLDLTGASVVKAIRRLIRKGLIEQQTEGTLFRSTMLWYDEHTVLTNRR